MDQSMALEDFVSKSVLLEPIPVQMIESLLAACAYLNRDAWSKDERNRSNKTSALSIQNTVVWFNHAVRSVGYPTRSALGYTLVSDLYIN